MLIPYVLAGCQKRGLLPMSQVSHGSDIPPSSLQVILGSVNNSYSGSSCVTGHSTSPSKTSSEAAFTVRGRPVRAWLTSLGINLVPCSAPWWTPWANLYHPPDCIPFNEILSACARERSSSLPCRTHRQASPLCFLLALCACSLVCAAVTHKDGVSKLRGRHMTRTRMQEYAL